MKLEQIAQWIGATGPLDDSMATFEPAGFSIDSRTVQAGELFFAIKGPIHDGHEFVSDALSRGACAAVISRAIGDAGRQSLDSAVQGWNREPESMAHRLLHVPDTLAALQGLARRVRRDWGGPVIAITGSAGKTATKELTAQLLSAGGAVSVKSIGNFNNAYGLPLSMLQLVSGGSDPRQVKYLVLEMGMNHPGEIADLCSIAEPDIGVVTLVAPVHLEFFSGIDEIAEAKAELVDHLKDTGLAVLNSDDPRVARMRFRRLIETRTFGIDLEADVRAVDVKLLGTDGSRFRLLTPHGEARVELPLIGRHNIYNALAAATVADYLDVSLSSLVECLAGATPMSDRGQVIRFAQGYTLINDVYNSNPRALGEMVNALCAANSVNRRIVVAGEMLELGVQSQKLHRESGREMVRRGVEVIVGVRGLAQEIVMGARLEGMPESSMTFCETPEEAGRWLYDHLKEGDLVLVKGSRGVRLERVIQTLQALNREAG